MERVLNCGVLLLLAWIAGSFGAAAWHIAGNIAYFFCFPVYAFAVFSNFVMAVLFISAILALFTRSR